VQRLVDLEMPIVAPVNGPAAVHSEYALLADVVIAAASAVFSDFPHLTYEIVPGDGIYLAWEEAIGVNGARYLTMTQGSFPHQRRPRQPAALTAAPNPSRQRPSTPAAGPDRCANCGDDSAGGCGWIRGQTD
jgi:hypothetical protein